MSEKAALCGFPGCQTRPKEGPACSVHRAAYALMAQQGRIRELELLLEEKRLELEIAEAERPRLSADDLEIAIAERIDELLGARVGTAQKIEKPPVTQKKRTLPAPPKRA